MWDFLKPSGKGGMVRTPLTPGEAAERTLTMEYRREFVCRCGASLKIRAREDRSDGPSNFKAYPPCSAHPVATAGCVACSRAGHSLVSSSELSWNGLAEERGWDSKPVRCPACQKGMTIKEYKHAKRQGLL